MSVALPLTNGSFAGWGPAPPTALPGAGISGQATVPGNGPTAADVQGMRPLSGLHNTPLHVGGIILFGLAMVVGLNMLGFRFAVDAGIGK